jgi:hypothetical protein
MELAEASTVQEIKQIAFRVVGDGTISDFLLRIGKLCSLPPMQKRQELVCRRRRLCIDKLLQRLGAERFILKYRLGNRDATTGFENAVNLTYSSGLVRNIGENRASCDRVNGCIADIIELINATLQKRALLPNVALDRK